MSKESPKVKKKSNLRKYFLRSFLILLLLTILIPTTIYFLSKTKFFQEYSAKIVKDFINDEIESVFSVGNINFKSFENIELTDIHLITKVDTLAKIDKIKIKLDIMGFFYNKVKIKKIEIINPDIKLIRYKDGIWNYTLIAKPTEKEKSNSKIPLINIYDLVLTNGKFLMVDSTLTNIETTDGKLNFSNLNLSDLNIKLNSTLNLNENRFIANIENIEFKETNSNFALGKTNLKNILISKNKIGFAEAKINMNGENIDFKHVFLKSFNLFEPNQDLNNSGISLEAISDNFSTKNINYFGLNLPEISQSINLDLDGKMNEIYINQLLINSVFFNIDLEGELNNLLTDLNYNITANELNLDKILLDSFFVNQLNFKNVSSSKFEIKGNTKQVSSDFALFIDNSEIKGNADVDFEKLDKINFNLLVKNFNTKLIQKDIPEIKFTGLINSKNNNLDFSKNNGFLKLNISNLIFDKIILDSSQIDISYSKGDFKIDNLKIQSNILNASAEGSTNVNSEIFNIKTKISNLNLDVFSKVLPKVENLDLEISGQNYDFDKSNIDLKSEYKGVLFNDIYITQLLLDLNISDESDLKNIKLNTNLGTMKINGVKKVSDLIDISKVIATNIDHKINKFFKNDTLSKREQFKLNDNDFDLELNLDNFSLINSFLKTNISSKLNLKSNFKVGEDFLNLSIDSLNVENTTFIQNNLIINFDKLHLSNKTNIDVLNSQIIDFTFLISTDSLFINDFNINKLDISSKLLNDNLELTFNSTFLDSNKLDFVTIVEKQSDLVLNFKSFNFNLLDRLNYKNNEDFTINLNDSLVGIKNFKLGTGFNEAFSIEGNYLFNTSEFQNISFSGQNVILKNYHDFPIIGKFIKDFNAQINSVNFTFNGKIENPNFILSIDSENLTFKNIDLGNLNSELTFADSLLYGDVYLFNLKNKSNLNVLINSLPIQVNSKNQLEFNNEKSTNILVAINDFPLSVIEPFIVGIRKVYGKINSDIVISNNPKGLNYEGALNFKNGSFLVEQTNMEYDFDGIVNIQNDVFSIEKFNLFNKKSDLDNGYAQITGEVILKDFNLEDFNFVMESKSIKLLRDESKFSMPNFFGDLIISTPSPITFYGNLYDSYLEGDVRILKAALNMPNKMESKFIQNKLKYVYKGNQIHIVSNDTIEKINRRQSSNFADNINYRLNIFFERSVTFDYDLNSIVNLKSEIGTKSKNEKLVYIKESRNNEPQLTGEIQLLNNSKISFLGKILNAGGEISFPTGRIMEPNLNITSKYNSKTSDGIKFEVRILITGSQVNPKVKFEYTYDGIEQNGDNPEIERDAFSLLTLNMKSNDALDGSGLQSNLQSEVFKTGSQFISSIASKSLSQALGVQTDITLDLNNPDSTFVTLKGDIFKGIQWSIGGTPSNPQTNEISIIIPIGILENVILELKKTNNPYVTIQNQSQWEVNLNWVKTW